ncbi:MAG: sugar phosphate isomerase/epimerase [Clostridia bacterium]|nr:sugar phosphate isomerase/epimerase [Clostridia bacterium]
MKTTISTEIGSIANYVGEEAAVRLVAEAGFDSFDLTLKNIALYDYGSRTVKKTGSPLESTDAVEYCRRLGELARELGITCNQSHAPYPVSEPVIRDSLRLALECTAAAGGEICVIHPNNRKSAEENAEMYLELLPYAKACGVKIATENMWEWDGKNHRADFAACGTPEDFVAHIKAVNDPYLVACVDVGHASMVGHLGFTPADMIVALGDSVQTLHLHDNDLHDDLHRIPYSLQMDYAPILAALDQIGYSGVFTLEVYKHLDLFGGQDIALHVREMADSAKALAQAYDTLRRSNND